MVCDTLFFVLQATTIAIPSIQIVQEKPLQWWIYALAALGGIILLILLALCLWKVGCQRNKTLYYVQRHKLIEADLALM